MTIPPLPGYTPQNPPLPNNDQAWQQQNYAPPFSQQQGPLSMSPMGQWQPPKKDSTALWLVLAAGVLFVALVIGGGFIYFGTDEKNSSRDRLSPTGAPYSFEMPEGFTEGTSRSDYQGSRPEYESSIVSKDSTQDTKSVIIISSTTLNIDSDNLSDEALTNELEMRLQNSGGDLANPKKRRIDNKRTFHYQVNWDGVDQWTYFTFSNKNYIQTRCQWSEEEKKLIQTACKKVVDSMKIRN